MTDTTHDEKPLAGYIDDLDERTLRLEDRMTDGEIALQNEKLQRRQDRDSLRKVVPMTTDSEPRGAEWEPTYFRGEECYRCGVLLYDGYPFTVCDECWTHRHDDDEEQWYCHTGQKMIAPTAGQDAGEGE